MKRVRDSMSPVVHTLSASDTAAVARESMLLHEVRHLPVLKNGTLVGLVSLSDLYALESIFGSDPDEVRLDELVGDSVYTVPGDTPLAEVAAHMAEHGLGSAVVMGDGVVEGIFTATDACRALAEVLRGD